MAYEMRATPRFGAGVAVEFEEITEAEFAAAAGAAYAPPERGIFRVVAARTAQFLADIPGVVRTTQGAAATVRMPSGVAGATNDAGDGRHILLINDGVGNIVVQDDTAGAIGFVAPGSEVLMVHETANAWRITINTATAGPWDETASVNSVGDTILHPDTIVTDKVAIGAVDVSANVEMLFITDAVAATSGQPTTSISLEVTGPTAVDPHIRLIDAGSGEIASIYRTAASLVIDSGTGGEILWVTNAGNTMVLSSAGLLNLSPRAAGTAFGISMETEMVSGTGVLMEYSGATNLTGDLTGFDADLNGSVTMDDGVDVRGYRIATPVHTQDSTPATSIIRGFSLETAGALNTGTAGAGNDIQWDGGFTQMPDFGTGFAGSTVEVYGLHIVSGTNAGGAGTEISSGLFIEMIGSGPVNPHIKLEDVGSGETGLIYRQNGQFLFETEGAAITFICDTDFSGLGVFRFVPKTSGIVIGIDLDTEVQNGTGILMNYSAATILNEDLGGVNVDFKAFVTPRLATAADLIGYHFETAGGTFTHGAGVTNIRGFDYDTADAIVMNNAGGILNWAGGRIQMPDITQTAGVVTAFGVHIIGGTVTSGTAGGMLIELTGPSTTNTHIQLEDSVTGETAFMYRDGTELVIDSGSGGILKLEVDGVNILNAASSGTLTLNEDGADFDVRIESATSNSLFRTNGGTNKVGIGGAPTVGILHVFGDLAVSEGIQASTAAEISIQVTNAAITTGSAGSMQIPYLDQAAGSFDDGIGGDVDGCIGINDDSTGAPIYTLEVRADGVWRSVAVAGYVVQRDIPFRASPDYWSHENQISPDGNTIDESVCVVCGKQMIKGDHVMMYGNYERDSDLHCIFGHLHPERDPHIQRLGARIAELETQLKSLVS